MRTDMVGAATDRMPGLAAATLARVKVDLKVFFRNGQSVGFTLAFPIMMLFLFASIFTGKVEGTDVTFSQLYVAGLIGSSAMATGFVNTAIVVALDRQRGEIKRLAGTPMPRAAFFLGRGLTVLVATALQVAILLTLGVAFYHLHLPDTVGRWLRFVAVLVLGVLAATLLGLAVGGRAANAKAVPAIVNLPFVFLQFISGVFIPFTQLSSSLTTLAGVFPLRWLGSGMRSVFLPDSFKAVEPSGTWNYPAMWAILLAWCIVGLVVCLRWFRWTDDKASRVKRRRGAGR